MAAAEDPIEYLCHFLPAADQAEIQGQPKLKKASEG